MPCTQVMYLNDARMAELYVLHSSFILSALILYIYRLLFVQTNNCILIVFKFAACRILSLFSSAAPWKHQLCLYFLSTHCLRLLAFHIIANAVTFQLCACTEKARTKKQLQLLYNCCVHYCCCLHSLSFHFRPVVTFRVDILLNARVLCDCLCRMVWFR